MVERSGDTDVVAAAELAELLGDLPLALQQACAYVEQTGMSVPDYVRLFRAHRAELLRDPGTVATTWGLAFDRLRRRSPLAAGVLETMSFLSADAVDVEMLWPLAEGDELDVQEAIGELLRLSLVDRKGAVLRVHRLVQDVVRARLPAATARDRLDAAVRLCLAVEADGGGAGAHLVQLAAHSEGLERVPPGLVDALAAVARRFTERALYSAAEQVLDAALRLVELSGTAVQRGALLCMLGEVLDQAGRLHEALSLHRQAVQLLDADPSADDLVLAHAYNRLGHVLNCADDTSGAIAAHECALKTLRTAHRDDLTAPVLIDLGYTLWADGRLDRAADALRAGRDLSERGSREWAHATAGLGMVAQDEGRLDEAVALQRLAIAEFTRIRGADHPDTAQAMDKLGYALRLRRRPHDAIEEHRRAAALLERVLGADDPRVAMTLSNLGLALRDAGLVDEAVEVQARAHQLFLTALGEAHASTLMAGRRRAVVLARVGCTVAARTVIEGVVAALADRVGDGELAAIAEDVAYVYEAAGDEESATRWRERVDPPDPPRPSCVCKVAARRGGDRGRQRHAPRGSDHVPVHPLAVPTHRCPDDHGSRCRRPWRRPGRVGRDRGPLRAARGRCRRLLPDAGGRRRRRGGEHVADRHGVAVHVARSRAARRVAADRRAPRVPRRAAPQRARGAGRRHRARHPRLRAGA